MSAAGDLRALAAALRGAAGRDMARAGADAARRAIERETARLTGGSLSGPNGGRLAVIVRPPSTAGAKITTVVATTGPWPLVERPRRGGYRIAPRHMRAVTVGGGRVRAGAVGGPIRRPLQPFARGAQLARQVVPDAVVAVVDRTVARA